MSFIPLLPRRRICFKRSVPGTNAVEIDRAYLVPVIRSHLIDNHEREYDHKRHKEQKPVKLLARDDARVDRLARSRNRLEVHLISIHFK